MAEMPNCLSNPSTSRGVASFGKQGGGGDFQPHHRVSKNKLSIYLFLKFLTWFPESQRLHKGFIHEHETAGDGHVNYTQLMKILDSEIILENLKKKSEQTGWSPWTTSAIPSVQYQKYT